MELKITDLLDDYMYDDFPLDEIVPEVHGEPVEVRKTRRKTGGKHLGQAAAAVLLVVSLSAAAALYLGPDETTSGKSLGEAEAAVSMEQEAEIPESEEHAETQEQATQAPTDVVGEEEAEIPMEEAAMPEAMESQEIPEEIHEPATEEAGYDVSVAHFTTDENEKYSLIVAVNPTGPASMTVEGELWLGSMNITEETVTFSLNILEDYDIGIVGSEEQLALGQTAEPYLQFFLLEAMTSDGKTVAIRNPDVQETELDGVYTVSGRWEEPVVPEEIEELVLKKAR